MELELKLALPLQDLHLLEKQLARVAAVGRRQPKRQLLYNTYYDTATHALQRQAVALRVRRIGDACAPQWVQTLKMGAAGDSALSRRGEWEAPISTDGLDQTLLVDTPWAELDADGSLFQALHPVFTTSFERLSWIVALDTGRVEVALDRGNVLIDGHSAPLCELEIELLDGSADAVFEVASQISQHISLMPLHVSKAERAYRLADGTLDAPVRAKSPALDESMDLGAIALSVLRESFLQFTANVYTLRSSDAPEVLHQARVGWRRFKGNLKLFRKLIDDSTFPSLAPLRPLLKRLTELRDLEVAATEVFPVYANAYQTGDAQRALQWSHLEEALRRAIEEQREGLRAILLDAAIGGALLQMVRWLETGTFDTGWRPHAHKQHSVTQWAQKRMARMAEQLRSLPSKSRDALVQHRRRILAKRMRYGVEVLQPLLPRKQAERWLQSAMQVQNRIGWERDLDQAIDTATRLDAAQGLVQFLRGVAYGIGQPPA
ncbi:MAG: CHAD domain-containing protein [Rhodoferax sp.]|nr:CHAD domain-containing protein [Rhodoferax sp.]